MEPLLSVVVAQEPFTVDLAAWAVPRATAATGVW
jgi:hypothetical protein